MAEAHATTIEQVENGQYWWACTCGDEGGPHDFWEQVYEATISHDKGVTRRAHGDV